MVAIMLYMEMPVAIFEAQRSKEQVLIDRGNEYVRGVKLYLRKVGQYPPSFDALENTNRMRFIRKRYKDPFTGKDDWRLLHAAPNGTLIDSKVNPTGNITGAGNSPLNANNKSAGNSPFSGFNSPSSSNSTSNNSTFSGFNAGPSSSTGGTGEAEVVVPKIPQRPPAVAANGEGNGSSPANPQDPFAAMNNPAPATGSPPSAGGNQTDPNAAPNTPQAAANGEAPAPNANSAVTPQSAAPQAFGANPAAAPRPNVTAGTGTSPLGVASTASSGLGVIQGGGTGIAGVASRADGHTIKTYNDQENYSLWEFYYDPTKDAMRNAAGAIAQMGGGNQGNAGNQPLGSSFNSGTNGGQSSGSGFNSGNNGSSGFGNFGGGLSGMQNSSRSGFSQSPGTQNTNNGFGGFGSSGFGNSSPPSNPPASPPPPPPQ